MLRAVAVFRLIASSNYSIAVGRSPGPSESGRPGSPRDASYPTGQDHRREVRRGVQSAQRVHRRQATSHCYINSNPVDRDRQGRVYVQQGKFAAGLLLFPRDAPFLAELEAELLVFPQLEAELLVFPQGRNDDQVDSITQALAYDPLAYDISMR